jgi:hypothetical protein
VRRAHMLIFTVVATVATVIALAAQPTIAFADSGAPAHEKLVSYGAIIAVAAVAVVLGVFSLWVIARWAWSRGSADTKRGGKG